MIRVNRLTTYPVKSCKGILSLEAMITKRGLINDRAFMVVDPTGVMVTQRRYPRMCLLRLAIFPPAVVLGFPELDDRVVAFLDGRDDGEKVSVSMWKETMTAYDQGEKLAGWLSECLEIPCRLVRMADDQIRKTRQGEGEVVFADAYSILGISSESLYDLNDRLESPIPMDRFRPNIVFEGAAPFAEDSWRRIRIGDVELVGETLCARCQIPTVDQQTGNQGEEPTRTLNTYRKVEHLDASPWKVPFPNNSYFGRNFNVSRPGVIKTDMEVEVLERD